MASCPLSLKKSLRSFRAIFKVFLIAFMIVLLSSWI